MKESFLTNYSDIRFLDSIKESLNNCTSFYFSVSFIKEAGLILIKDELEKALIRGVQGKIITSTYQNFTDIPSLELFLSWMEKYPNFSCHLDYDSFKDNGFHSKGYIFEINNQYEFLIGSTNITRFALLKNIERNVSLKRNTNDLIIKEAIKEFDYLRNQTLLLTQDAIKHYRIQLDYAIEKRDMDYDISYENKKVMPNAMQRKALKELRRYRDMGVNKALIVAATASGKTYLSAFDARNFDAKRLLFIVHRDTILEDAKKTFQRVFMSRRTYGLFTGQEKNIEADFIFATNVTMSTHLDYFDPKEFDYIVFDECHHITAATYQKIMNYFKPHFLLGLTATPERMDNQDVFDMFDKNVPYELRLKDAIKNDLVVPFKYFGVRDTFVDYSTKDKINFLSEYFKDGHIEMIAREIEKHRQEGKLKAVGFCRSIEHAQMMSHKMNELGYCTTCLTGKNLTGERLKAYTDLQDDDSPLEIIFTVDILNEGIDIPAINMVLFLRPTESQTIFIQQLGRGLRKYKDKEYLTVIDFIGNSYERSIQVAFALGTLSNNTYLEKALVSSLIKDNFKDLNLPGVEIYFDEYSKEEILKYVENTNFNTFSFLKQDYFNFKKFLLLERYPTHLDFLHSDCAPDLLRFIKSKYKGKKIYSYYNFLKYIDEDVPVFNDDEVNIINALSDLLPLTRKEEYLIIQELLKNNEVLNGFNLISGRITEFSITSALNNLSGKKIIKKEGIRYKLNLESVPSESYIEFLNDIISYGLERYEIEFGDFVGPFKLYANYQKDKIMLELDGKQFPFMLGTKYDIESRTTYVFVGLKKDLVAKGNFAYKDKFLSPSVFQWESVNNTTKSNKEGEKLLLTKTVHLFIRKMDDEDGIVLPFTYFGTGKFTNCRESTNDNTPTLLFDIVLDNEVPEEYHFDFQIPEETKEYC